VNLGQTQRALFAEPLGDAILVRRHLLPFRARVACGSRLHPLRAEMRISAMKP
jgi:hypothetical protein